MVGQYVFRHIITYMTCWDSVALDKESKRFIQHYKVGMGRLFRSYVCGDGRKSTLTGRQIEEIADKVDRGVGGVVGRLGTKLLKIDGCGRKPMPSTGTYIRLVK